jgi:hypothetical protein
MITAAEYRTWAEESLKWAGEATTPEERDAHIRSAEIWLQSALRSERLSKQPLTTEYEWVLPPFNNGGARGVHLNEKRFDQFRSGAKPAQGFQKRGLPRLAQGSPVGLPGPPPKGRKAMAKCWISDSP